MITPPSHMQDKRKFMKIKRKLKQCINQNDLQIFKDVVKNKYKHPWQCQKEVIPRQEKGSE